MSTETEAMTAPVIVRSFLKGRIAMGTTKQAATMAQK